MKVSRFEDLFVWQKAKTLCIEVYRTTARGRLSQDFGLRDQMQRAAVSVMSNIAEGFDRNSRAEFARFLSIARGSSGELRSQLYVARELEYIDDEQFARLMALSMETTRMLVSLRKSLGS
jgi:four helix bundle protein